MMYRKWTLSAGLALVLGISTLDAGGKLTAPAVVPVVPVTQERNWDGLYVGGALYYNNIYSADYSWFDDATDTQDEIGGLTAIVGYNINEYLAVEARASKEFFKEDYADEYHFSFFAKPQYRFRSAEKYEENYFTVYGLLGFGYVNIEGTDGNTPGDPTIVGKTLIDDWTFQYGLGVSYTFVDEEHPENDSGDWSVFVEYTVYMTDQSMSPSYLYDYNPNLYDELSMNGLSVGITYQF
jgi:opacity protein-like surface antigen